MIEFREGKTPKESNWFFNGKDINKCNPQELREGYMEFYRNKSKDELRESLGLALATENYIKCQVIKELYGEDYIEPIPHTQTLDKFIKNVLDNMAHPEQSTFCKSVKKKYPHFFIQKNPAGPSISVLDVGSLDINGNNRYLWEGFYDYLGIDVGMGKNVDIVCKGHEFHPGRQYDVVISTECFEHDQHWKETIQNCINLVKSHGLFIFTCATTGRQEHGTTRTTPQDSPFTHTLFNDYYMNLTEQDIVSIPDFLAQFSECEFSTNNKTKDLYFYGIKK